MVVGNFILFVEIVLSDAIKIAKKFNGEIISADSRQVYRRMDIGTGKVKSDKRQGTRDMDFHVTCHMFHVTCSEEV